ncbi:NAD(P)-dependent oxidoreductase, partial [Candidatus Pacearchaeota archaeon]
MAEQSEFILIFGGTGFVGKWLIKTFFKYFSKLSHYLLILSRNPEKILTEVPELTGYQKVCFLKGDVRNFKFPREKIDFVIHCAMPANYEDFSKEEILEIGINGTKRVIEFARYCKVKKLLFVSSGVVYGKQPSEIKKLSENSFGSLEINPNNPKIYYAEAKRIGELLCYGAMKEWGLNIVIARCFSFIGPFMPLDAHFAIGNF